MAENAELTDLAALAPGERVEVRTRFDRRWANGFEVAEATETGYRVRRLSDGEMLPTEFTPDEVRKERKRQAWWW
ncbi:MAG: hypothetical protein ACRD29_17985 [Acidimicrobiales bacterium]